MLSANVCPAESSIISLIFRQDNFVFGFGALDYNLCLYDHDIFRLIKQLVPSTVIQVCCGRNHSICLADGKLVPCTVVQVCFGTNYSICLADGKLVPSTVIQVCCGKNHSICLGPLRLELW